MVPVFRNINFKFNRIGSYTFYILILLDYHRLYEDDPRSNANWCVISFTTASFQDSLHQNYDALSILPDPKTF